MSLHNDQLDDSGSYVDNNRNAHHNNSGNVILHIHRPQRHQDLDKDNCDNSDDTIISATSASAGEPNGDFRGFHDQLDDGSKQTSTTTTNDTTRFYNNKLCNDKL